ncbi:MAG: TolC family protein [Gammaproteobacteria bacterium]|nr:TolC family protein [Gammaproteobacteria bacterium]
MGGTLATSRVGRLALGLSLVIAAAAPASARLLNEELSHLLAGNPQLGVAKERVGAAGQAIREARGAFFPTISADGDYGYSRVDSPARRGVGLGPSSGPRSRIGLNATLNLFDGFRKYANMDRTRLQLITAQIDLENTRQTLLFQGASAYINVRRQRQLVVLAKLNETTIRRQLNLENERVRRGSGLSVDVLQSKSRLQIAKQLRVIIEGDLRTAMSRYIRVFGRAPNLSAMKDPIPPAGQIPSSLEKALSSATSQNPRLKKSARQIEIIDQRKREARSPLYPRLDLVVEGRREENIDGIAGVKTDVTVMVRMTWELFNGLATQSRVLRLARLRAAAMNNNRFVYRQVSDDARTAWHRLDTARKRRDLLVNAINISVEVFRARRALRAAGKETVINVLDAEREVNSARIQHTAARYNAILSEYRVLFALGILTPSTLGLIAK